MKVCRTSGVSSEIRVNFFARVMNTFCKTDPFLKMQVRLLAAGELQVKSKTTKGLVCILFGDLPNAGQHAVVVYGYNEYENSGYYT